MGVQFSVEDLKQAARNETGLDDFGDPWFEVPLAALVKALNEEADLSEMGGYIQGASLTKYLGERLRKVQLFKDHPEIAAEEVGVLA
ncbi:MAG: hypothetical protein WC493_23550, partial [Zavarzinia sp.]